MPADVLLRMSSNWARCLVWQWPVSAKRVARDLNCLQRAVDQQRCWTSNPDEDHRRFLDVLQKLLSTPSRTELLEHSLTFQVPVLLHAIQRFCLIYED